MRRDWRNPAETKTYDQLELENQNVNQILIENQDWSYDQQTLEDKPKNSDRKLSKLFFLEKRNLKSEVKTLTPKIQMKYLSFSSFIHLM